MDSSGSRLDDGSERKADLSAKKAEGNGVQLSRISMVGEDPISDILKLHSPSELESTWRTKTSSIKQSDPVASKRFTATLTSPKRSQFSEDKKVGSKTLRTPQPSLTPQNVGTKAVLPSQDILITKASSEDSVYGGAATLPSRPDQASPQPHQESLATPAKEAHVVGYTNSSRLLSGLMSPSSSKSEKEGFLSLDTQTDNAVMLANPDQSKDRQVGNRERRSRTAHSSRKSTVQTKSPEGEIHTISDATDREIAATPATSITSRTSIHLNSDSHREKTALQSSGQSSRKEPTKPTSSFLEERSNHDNELDKKKEPITVKQSTAKKKTGKRSSKSMKTSLADVGKKIRGKIMSSNTETSKTERKGKQSQVRKKEDASDISPTNSRSSSPTGEKQAISLSPLASDLDPEKNRPRSQEDGLRSDNSVQGRLAHLGQEIGGHLELLAAAGLSVFALFRIRDSETPDTFSKDTKTSLSVISPLSLSMLVLVLAVIPLSGMLALALGKTTLKNVMPSTLIPSRASIATNTQQSYEQDDPENDKMASDVLDGEDVLLSKAQEKIRRLFPDQDLQITMFPLFLDLVQAPWQELEPELWRGLRREAKRHWGAGHKDRLESAVIFLREIAVQLFTDYLKVEDRGAYLTGELLRIEMMSNPDAIRISLFLGDDVNETRQVKANWERSLRTIKDLPDKWSDIFPNQTMPPVEIVACRPPADFDSAHFQFLRDCTNARGRVSKKSLDRLESVKQQWSVCKTRGTPLSGLRNHIGAAGGDERDQMLLDLFKLTKPPRITVDYLPHRHRQADILGWSRGKTASRILRTSCFQHVARACAAYTKEHDLDILDLGPCLSMDRKFAKADGEPSSSGSHFAFSKTRVNILRISLDESIGSADVNGRTEVACLAEALCHPKKRLLTMFTADQPPWLVVHVRAAAQKTEFRDVLEGCLFAHCGSDKRVPQMLALMSRVCCTSDSTTSSTRIWSDAEIALLKTAVMSV